MRNEIFHVGKHSVEFMSAFHLAWGSPKVSKVLAFFLYKFNFQR